jgi:hypothetical protein
VSLLDTQNAATWVDAVNRFLETKRDAAPPNARVAPQAPAAEATSAKAELREGR